MHAIMKTKLTAQIQGEPVLFMTGMRINSWWRLREWITVMSAATAMIRDLDAKPELGLLSQRTWLGQTIVIVQYWRSYEDLERYARNKSERHLPAWVHYAKRLLGAANVGIWHETYRITPGNYETIYVNMPSFGLAKATTAVAITGPLSTARARMAKDVEREAAAA